jgi:hypothetical protein
VRPLSCAKLSIASVLDFLCWKWKPYPRVVFPKSRLVWVLLYIWELCCLWRVLICVQVANTFWWGWGINMDSLKVMSECVPVSEKAINQSEFLRMCECGQPWTCSASVLHRAERRVWALHSRRDWHRHLLGRSWLAPKTGCNTVKTTQFLPLPGIEPQLHNSTAHSLVTTMPFSKITKWILPNVTTETSALYSGGPAFTSQILDRPSLRRYPHFPRANDRHYPRSRDDHFLSHPL